MSDKQKLQAIYGELKSSKFGKYITIKKELDLLGMSSSIEEIEVLHSIVMQSNSLKDALDLADKLSESEKLKLRNEVKTNYDKKEETKRKALERKKAEEAKKAEQKEAAEAKEEIKKGLKKMQNLENRQIDTYKVVKGKTLNELQGQVLKYMGRGYVPLGGVAAAAFGAGIYTGNSYVQAMVKYK